MSSKIGGCIGAFLVQASPRTTNMMLKKSATLRSRFAPRLNRSPKPYWILASSLAAALLDGLFEHPAKYWK